MKKLLVRYCGWGESWHFGTLAHDGSELLFEYSPEAVRQGLDLSPRHLKLQAQAYGGFPLHLQRLPGLIADCLPDGWGFQLMDRFFRSIGRDPTTCSPLDRLAFIGDRAMGALTFEPADVLHLPARDLELLELARDVQSVVAGHGQEVLTEIISLGGSPQGARPKALVYCHPQSESISTRPAPGHRPLLIKFQGNGEHREVCAIEDTYCRLARACGLDVPQTHYFSLSRSLAAFGIERFDRHEDYRVPMHTLTGALHADFRLPSVDYGTFLRAIRLFTRDESEVQKGYERAVFNVLFNNRDRTWQLAPCYDLTFSTRPGGEHHMDVCGEGRNIAREHMRRLARETGVKAKFATSVLEQFLERSGQFQRLAKDSPIRQTMVKTIVAAIEANRERLS